MSQAFASRRRSLLKVIATASLASCAARRGTRRNQHVVVAGAGIVGASIAYHLAQRGVAVTVIDRSGPATRASRGTFAWINASWAKQPRYYHALSQQGVAGWHRLQRALDIPVRWGGSIEWFDSRARQATLVRQIKEQKDWGEPASMCDANTVAGLEPNLVFPGDRLAALSMNDGALDPVRATNTLLRAAERYGARLRYRCALKDVVLRNDRLVAVDTSLGLVEADSLVLATGAAQDLPRRIAGIDVPQRSTPGVIVLTEPMPRILQRVIVAPGVHMHQRDDLRMVLGEQAGPPATTVHAGRLASRPNAFPGRDIAMRHADRVLATARRYVPALADAMPDDVYIGWRPLPLDGLPVLGPSPVRPDVYLAIMHSGVTLAPVVGEKMTEMLIGDARPNALGEYRPGRDFSDGNRY